jgi:transcriptional regulator with XRE-family HTH domain
MKKPPCEFGEYIKKLRGDKKLNGTEVAKSIGLSQATYSCWEQGKIFPDFEQLIALMRSLDLRWPESKEFLTNALNNFNGKIDLKALKGGIIPYPLLIELLAIYFSADYDTDRDGQLEAANECTDKIKKHLEALKKEIANDHHVAIGPNAYWKSPLLLLKNAKG